MLAKSFQLSQRFSTLLIAETKNGKLSKTASHSLAAATQLGKDIDVIILSDKIDKSSLEALNHSSVKNIYTGLTDSLKHPTADQMSFYLQSFIQAQSSPYTHILTCGTSFAKDHFPRLSGALQQQPITDISGIVNENTFERPVYAGNAVQTVQSSNSIHMITIRSTNFEPLDSSKLTEDSTSKVKDVPNFDQILADFTKQYSGRQVEFIKEELVVSERPELTDAKFVVSGGRGLKSGENFKLLEELADALGNCAIGASRAAVDAGFCSNDMQVGQTGKVVAPELYIAVGISGQVQHLAGMKDSKVIVAINKNEEEPIFQIASYGLKADLFDAVPELTQKLKAMA